MARERRRLAAILAADMVDYSRHMSSDESGTLARLKSLRADVFDVRIAEYGGKVMGSAGDSLLVEFASAVDAVQCAAEIQRAISTQNDSVSDEYAMLFRIGINLGDVIADGETIYGDGVNVAARLERLAEPGSVVVSRAVRDQVHGKVQLGFFDLGDHVVKNIAEPLRAFRVEPATSEYAPRRKHADERTRRRLTIAVTPFANIGDNPEQRFFADGITEDVITELSRFHRLAVLSAQSSSRYQDLDDSRGAARELGIHYLVEGSVRRSGEQIRITAKLRDAASHDQLWADRFDRDTTEIFAVQDQIVSRIVATIAGRVEAAGAERSRRKLPSSLEAYECVLRGRAATIGDPESEAEAQRLYERAIELDPGYALANALLAYILSLVWLREDSDSDANLERAYELARHSVMLDPNEPECQNTLGWVHLHRREFALAEQYFSRALELNPNDAEQTAYMAVLQSFLGNSQSALEWFRATRQLDPLFDRPWYWSIQGVAHFTANRLDQAIADFCRSPIMPVWVHVYLAACHALDGNMDRAASNRARLFELMPKFSGERFIRKEPLCRKQDLDRLREGMRLAGLSS